MVSISLVIVITKLSSCGGAIDPVGAGIDGSCKPALDYVAMHSFGSGFTKNLDFPQTNYR